MASGYASNNTPFLEVASTHRVFFTPGVFQGVIKMATRSQCIIKSVEQFGPNPVCIYQHWDGYALGNFVRNAISKQQRWSDHEYLARIIFCTMLQDEEQLKGSTGFGLSTRPDHEDIEYYVLVDCDAQTVTEYNGYGNPPEVTTTGRVIFDSNWDIICITPFSECVHNDDPYRT